MVTLQSEENVLVILLTSHAQLHKVNNN